MTCQLKCISASILLHIAACFLAATLASTFAGEPKPVTVDLTLTASRGSAAPGQETGNEKSGRRSTRTKTPETRDKKTAGTIQRSFSEKSRPEAVMRVPANPVTPEIAEGPHRVQPSKIMENVSPAAPAPEMARSGKGAASGGSGPGHILSGSGSGSEAGGGSGTGADKGQGGSGQGTGASAGQMKKKYLSEQFEYIKSLIDKNLVYPPRAKRMEWYGRVAVSFIILENGRVANINIVRSSGYELLDDNVVETIKKVQPFPKPPIRAEIKIPITYRLDY